MCHRGRPVLSTATGDSFCSVQGTVCDVFQLLPTQPPPQVVHTSSVVCHMQEPYIPGFLAFREVPHLLSCFRELQEGFWPQVILVDGNGVLHPRGFGLASHLGVLLDLPTIGVAKNLLCVDRLERKDPHYQDKVGSCEGCWVGWVGHTPSLSPSLR